MQHAGADGTFKGHRAGLGHAVVIAHACAGPKAGDALAHRRHGAAWFARDEDGSHTRGAEIDAFLRRHFRQMQRIGGRAAQHGGAVVQDGADTRGAAESAAGQAAATHLQGGFKGEPEAQERPEGEREEHGVALHDARGAQHDLPVPQHHVPALRRVEPVEGASAGAAGLVAARVVFERIGEVGAVRRIGRLVRDELVLRGEGEAIVVVVQARDLAGCARGIVFGGVEGIGGRQPAEQFAQLFELTLPDDGAPGKDFSSHR